MKKTLPLVLFASLALFFGVAQAHGDPIAEGKKLVEEHKCETCHHNKTMGDAKAIYLRKDRKVTSMEKLKAQVSMCNTQLNLKLFPEDEEDIAAYLNETYYKFKK